jgi:hypothetical protein
MKFYLYNSGFYIMGLQKMFIPLQTENHALK